MKKMCFQLEESCHWFDGCLFRLFFFFIAMGHRGSFGISSCNTMFSHLVQNNMHRVSLVLLSPRPGESERPVVFESGRGSVGEELDFLRTVIDQRRADGGEDGARGKASRRRKRFLSYPRYVELMVTADAKMTRHHGRNLEHYILTIMSVVSKILFLNFLPLSLSHIQTSQCLVSRSDLCVFWPHCCFFCFF